MKIGIFVQKLALALTAALILPFTAIAHERWFVHTLPSDITKPLLFSHWSGMNALMVVGAVIALLLACVLHVIVSRHPRARDLTASVSRFSVWVPTVLRTCAGILLFAGSFSHFVFAPDLDVSTLSPALAHVLVSTELIVGLALIIGVFPRIMSGLGLLLFVSTLFIFPFMQAFAYVGFVGIFSYLIIIGDTSLPKVEHFSFFPHAEKHPALDRLRPYAMTILRVSLGLGFAIVAIMYKIVTPQYALEFVATHSVVNFMPAIGFANFTDDMFVLCAGLTELLLGVLIILGVLPRIIGAFLFVMFTLTLGLFGPYELLGHLPLYAMAFALITKGAGEKGGSILRS